MTIKCVVSNLLSAFSAVSIERSVEGKVSLVATNQVVEDPLRDEMHEGKRRYSALFQQFHETYGYIAHMTLTIKSKSLGSFLLVEKQNKMYVTVLCEDIIRFPIKIDSYIRETGIALAMG